MFAPQTLVGFSTIALLVGYLLLARWQRWHRRATDPQRELGWAGQPFDARPLQQRLERVRQDYAAASVALPRQRLYRANLLASARRAIVQLAFFHGRELLHDADAPRP